MDQSLLREFIKAAVKSGEVTGADPYAASFSTGNSGLSYGTMQNDVANNTHALATFTAILNYSSSTTGLTQSQIKLISDAAHTKNMSVLNTYLNQINQALSLDKSAIDAEDLYTLNSDVAAINQAFSAASANPDGAGQLNGIAPDPAFIAELANWSNRTGGLKDTSDYLKNSEEVTKINYDDDYLSIQKQFTTNGESFSKWQNKVSTATAAALKAINATVSYFNSVSITQGQTSSSGSNFLSLMSASSGSPQGILWNFSNSVGGVNAGDTEVYVNSTQNNTGILQSGSWGAINFDGDSLTVTMGTDAFGSLQLNSSDLTGQVDDLSASDLSLDFDLSSVGYTWSLSGDGETDTLTGITGSEILIASKLSDTILGSSGNETLYGGDKGNDILTGGGGDNTFIGGSGDDGDVFNAGAGKNTMIGGNGNDIFNAGTGQSTMIGGSGDDIFYANSNTGAGQSTMIGGSGIDTFYAVAGDTIVGFTTDDTLIVDGNTLTGPTSGGNDQKDDWGNSYHFDEGRQDADVTITLASGGTIIVDAADGEYGRNEYPDHTVLPNVDPGGWTGSITEKLKDTPDRSGGGGNGGGNGGGGSGSLGNPNPGTDNAAKDPLVVDLVGTGLNLTAETSADAPYVNWSGGDFANRSGWVGTGSGLLVIAPSDGSSVTAKDLVTSFAQLAALDSNGDGVINASDPGFADLVIWQGSDGTSGSGTTETLAQLGVVSISLATTATDTTINGNTVTETATLTMANGSTRTIGAVDLTESTSDTKYVGPDVTTLAADALPQVIGWGTLTDLRTAMSTDSTLLTEVQNVLTVDPENIAAADAATAQIVTEWAGCADDAKARGAMDGKIVGVLNALAGQSFSDVHGHSGPRYWETQVVPMSVSWDRELAAVKTRLLVQDHASPLSKAFCVDANTNLLLPRQDLAASVRTLIADAPKDAAAALPYWINALTALSETVSDDSQAIIVDSASLLTQLQGANLPFSPEVLAAAAAGTLTYISGSTAGATDPGQSSVIGSSGVNLIDVTGSNISVQGQGGGDEIVVNSGLGTTTINEADGILTTQSGSFSKGTYSIASAANTLLFAAGIDPSQVTVSLDAKGDVILTLDASGDKVVLTGMANNSHDGVQEVKFADGTTWSAAEVMAKTSDTAQSKFYYQNYTLASGSGQVVVEAGAQGNLTLGAGLTEADVTLSADANGDLTVSLKNNPSDSITFLGALTHTMNWTPDNDAGGFYNFEFGQGGVESSIVSSIGAIRFTDGSSLDLSSTSGNGWAQIAVAGAKKVGLDPTTGISVESVSGDRTVLKVDWAAITAGGASFVNTLVLGDFQCWYGTTSTVLDLTGISESDILLKSDANGVLTISQKSNPSCQILLAGEGGDLAVTTLRFSNGQTLDLASEAGVWSGHVIQLSGAQSEAINAVDATDIRLAFTGAATIAADITFQSDGDNLIVSDSATGAKIIAAGDLKKVNGTVSSNIGSLSFADGSTLAIGNNLSFTWDGMAGDQALTGSQYGSNRFLGADGDVINSVGNKDTIVVGANAGRETLNLADGASDSLQFTDATTTAADITFQADGNNLIISDSATGAKIIAAGDLKKVNGTVSSNIGSLSFADGSTLAIGNNLLFTWDGTAGDQALTGSQYGSNRFLGADGDTINSVGNKDTIVVGANAGRETLNLADGASDNLQFTDAATTAADIIFQADGNNLIISDSATGAEIVVAGDLYHPDGYSWERASNISAVTFANGSTLDISGNIEFTWNGSAGNQTLTGSDYGSNLFLGADGDTINVASEGGGNTIVLGANAGHETVNMADGFASLQFTDATTAADISLKVDAAGDLTVTDSANGASLTFNNDMGNFESWKSRLEEITFSDGSTLDISTPTFTWNGSAGNQVVEGSSYGNNRLIGGNGDRLIGASGGWNEYVLSSNAGHETIVPGGYWSGDTIAFTGSLTAADMTLQAYGNDLVISDAAAGIAITVQADLFQSYDDYGDDYIACGASYVSTIGFADGTSINLTAPLTFTYDGSTGNQNLTGSNYGSNVFLAGNGDILNGATNETNTYDIGLSSGNVTINVGARDTIAYTDATTSADLSLQVDGSALLVIDSADGTTLTLNNDIVTIGSEAVGQVSTIKFANGSTLDISQIPEKTWDGSAGGETLIGTSFVLNTFVAGNGDTLTGGGTDTYQFGADVGQVTINPGQNDTIQFTDATTAADLTLKADGSTEIITDTLTGTVITVDNDLSTASGGGVLSQVNKIKFADGTQLDLNQKPIVLLNGSAGNKSLVGSSLATNVFIGGNGDILTGAGLGNTYELGSGAGQETINAQSGDVIAFTDGTIAADITMQADGQGDLIIKDSANGAQITVAQALLGATASTVSAIDFADGSRIDLTQSLVLTWDGTAGNQTLVGSDFAPNIFLTDGAASDTIFAGTASASLVFTDDTTASDITLQTAGNGDLILTDTRTGAKTTIAEDLQTNQYLSSVQFKDGTSIDLTQTPTFTWDGTGGNQTLTGNTAGNNLFLGGNGDTLNGAGTDTFVLTATAGSEVINPSSWGGDTIMFTDATAADFSRSRQGTDLILTNARTGATVTIKDEYTLYENAIESYAIYTVNFADGTSLDLTQPIVDTWDGTAGNMTLIGNASADSNVFLGGKGDTLDGAGTDTYVLDANAGTEVIKPGSQDIVSFSDASTATDVHLTTDKAGDLIITDLADGAVLTVVGDLTQTEGTTTSQVKDITFANGSSIDLTKPITFTWDGSAGKQTLTGSTLGTNVFFGGNGDSLDGVGTDTYVLGGNAGTEVIKPGSQDIVSFSDGSTATDVHLTTDEAGDLIITDLADGAVLTVVGDLTQTEGTTTSQVKDITFANGSSIDLTKPITFTWDGTAGKQTLTGSTLGTNVFLGGNGDTLDGEKNDTYVLGANAGTEIISPSSQGVIKFTDNTTAKDIRLTTDAIGDLIITDLADGAKITVLSDLDLNGATELLQVQSIDFANGASLSLTGTLTFTWDGTTGGQSLAGSGYGSNLFLAGNSDVLTGVGSDTYSVGAGVSTLTINPGSNDTIAFTDNTTAKDIHLGTDAAGDLIVTDTANGAVVTVKADLSLVGSTESSLVKTLTFANGTSLNISGGLPTTSIIGSNGSTLVGSGFDTYVFGADAGQETILPGNQDIIRFTDSTTLANLNLTTDAAGDLIISDSANGADITVKNDLSLVNDAVNSKVKAIILANGTSLDLTLPLAFTWNGTAGNLTLQGSPFGSNVFLAGTNDTLIGGGTDLFQMGSGVTNLTITPGNQNTLSLTDDSTASDILFQADSAGDLTLQDTRTGAVVTMLGDLSRQNGKTVSKIQSIQFADGTWIDPNHTISFTYDGRAGDQTLTGTTFGLNTFLGGNGDTLNGAGTDTYVLGATAGTEVINPGSKDTIVFTDGSTTADVLLTTTKTTDSLTVDSSNKMVTVSGSGMSLVLSGSGLNTSISSGVVTLNKGGVASVTGNSDTVTAGASDILSVTGVNDTVTVSGTGTSLSLSGSGLSTSISSGTVAVEDGTQADVTGNSDIMTAGTSDIITVTGANDTVTVAGSGTSLVLSGSGLSASISSGRVTVGDGTQASVTGSSDTIMAGISAVLSVTGVKDTVTGSNTSVSLSGSGLSASISSGTVTVADGTQAIVTGNSDIMTAGASDVLTVTGANDTVTVSGTGTSLELSGSSLNASISKGAVTLDDETQAIVSGSSNRISTGNYDILTVTGTNNTVAMTGTGTSLALSGSDTVTLSDDIQVAISGNSSTLTAGNNDILTVTGSNDAVTVTGTGTSLSLSGRGVSSSISSGTLTLSAGAQASVTGNSDTIAAGASDVLSVTGTNDTVTVSGVGTSLALSGSGLNASISSGTIALAADAQASVTGNSDTIAAGASDVLSVTGTNDTVTVSGVGTSLALSGSGLNASISSGALAVADGAQVRVTGNSDSITAGASDVLSVTGTNDTVTVSGAGTSLSLSGSGLNALISSGTLTLGNGSQATVSGNSDVFTAGVSDVLSVTGTNDTVTVSGTGTSLSLSGSGLSASITSGTVTLSHDSQASISGSGNTVTGGIGIDLSLSGSNNIVNANSGTVRLSGSGSFAVTGSQNTLIGGNGSETLTGSGGNTFIVGKGSETLIGGTGDDTYDYLEGAGQVTIIDSGSSNTLQLGTGLTAANITFTQEGSNLLIGDGVAGDQIDIVNQYNGAARGIDTLVFSDGSTMSLLGGEVIYGVAGANVTGTQSSDTLIGGAGAETLTGGGGNDTFIAGQGTETLVGSKGDDTYIYAKGTGQVVINDAGGDNALVLGTGLTAANVTFTLAADGHDLLIGDGTATDQIDILNQYSGTGCVIDSLRFGNGSTMNLTSSVLIGNAGKSILVAPGAQANLSASNATISIGSGATVAVAGSGDTVAVIGVGTSVTLTGSNDGASISGGTLTLGNGSQATVSGNSDAITAGATDVLSVTGSNDTVTVTGKNTSLSLSGSGLSASITSGTLTLGNGSQATVFGNSDTITAGASDALTVTGSNDAVTVTGKNTSLSLSGSGLSTSITSGTLTLGNGSQATVSGNSDTITAGATDVLSVTGSNDAVTVTGKNTSLSLSGSGLSASISSGTLTLGNGSQATVSGNSDLITAGATDVLSVTGSNDAVTVTGKNTSLALSGSGLAANISNGTVTLSSGSQAAIQGSGDKVTVGSNARLSLTGSNDTIIAIGAGSSLTLDGTMLNASISNGSVEFVSGSDVSITNNAITVAASGVAVSGTNDTVSVDGGVLAIANQTKSSIYGSDDMIFAGNQDILSVDGVSDTIWLTGSGSTLDLAETSASQVEVFGNLNVLTLGNDDGGFLFGSNNTVALGSSDTLTANGGNSTITLGNADQLTANGCGFAIAVAGNSTVTVNGGGNTVTASGNRNVLTENGSGNSLAVDGNDNTLTVNGNGDQLTVSGNNNSLAANGWNDTVTLTGLGNTLSIGGDSVTLAASSQATINGGGSAVSLGSADRLVVNGGGFAITLNGDDSSVTANGGGNSFTVKGDDNSVTANGSGDTLTANGSGNALTANGNGDVLTVNGDSNQETVGDCNSLSLSGNANQVTLGSNDRVSAVGQNNIITVTGGNNQIQTSGSTVALNGVNTTEAVQGNNDTITVNGAGNVVSVTGSKDTIVVAGSGTTMLSLKNAANDIVQLGNGASIDQLWFSRQGNDLVATVIGTKNRVDFANWYGGTSSQAAELETKDGHILLNTQVNNLVNAMAGLTPPPVGQTTLSTALANQLEPKIAANWH